VYHMARRRQAEPTRNSAAHLNQKPLEFMEHLVRAVTEVDESFGNLSAVSRPPQLPPWRSGDGRSPPNSIRISSN